MINRIARIVICHIGCLFVAACTESAIFGPIGTDLANPLGVAVNPTGQRAYLVNANDKYLYTDGSLHVINLSTITAPTRVNSVTLASFGGQPFYDATNARVLVPNRLSDDETDTVDQVLEVNVNEAAGTFLSVSAVEAGGNPFGTARDAGANRLLVPTREATLEVYDLAVTPLSRVAQVSLQRTLSDGSTLDFVPAVEAVVINANTQAVVTRSAGGLLVMNLAELTTSGVNPVDYFISDIESPRGVATDGTLLYVVDLDTGTDPTTNLLRVLDLSSLAVDGTTATTTIRDKDDQALQVATVQVGNNPQGVVVSAGLGRAYVSNLDDDTISVIDTAARTKLTDITVGDEPFGLALYQTTPGGADTHLLVCNRQSNTLSIIDLATNAVIATYPQ